jgi:putative PIN family toxin of toxin-antitoxin system
VIEVVLDTNVLVAAFRSSLGVSHRLIQDLESASWRPVISPALALEYEAVLKRLPLEYGFTIEDIDDFLDYLFSRSTLVQIYFSWRPSLRDPNDDRILEVAVRAQCPVVTFNRKDFDGAARFGITVLSPKEFLIRLTHPAWI